MMNTGKCPKCGWPIAYVRCESIDAQTEATKFLAVSYCCPSCQSVLGVGVDPEALKAEIAKEVKGR